MRRPSFAALLPSKHLRKLSAGTALCAAAAIGFYFWHAASAPVPQAIPSPPAAAQPPAPAAPVQIAVPIAAQAIAPVVSEVLVGKNDTLDAIFKRLALDPADLAAIRQMPGMRQNLDLLKPGDLIKLTHSDGSVKELSRKVSETRTLHVVRNDAGFEASFTDDPVDMRTRIASATIDSSLFQAAASAHMSDTVALRLAGIFAWDIDFVLDIREGDRFTALYQQIYQDGKYLRDGEVLAAEFVNNGRVYRAVRFINAAGAAGYYAPDGKPMRKAFLRAPVEFTRVSSVFNPHRLHPILNLIRGHMGTDYAAPVGTPVHAAGDGRVSFEGTRGGYGNAVVLSHGNNISTLYGHMSRFARNIRVGSPVQQGQVIGYVGMSGLATGPHLHYEYLINGVHKDPQTVRLPGAEPLRAEALAKFRADTATLLAALTPPPAQLIGPQYARQQAAPAQPDSPAGTELPSGAKTPGAAPPSSLPGIVSPYSDEPVGSVN